MLYAPVGRRFESQAVDWILGVEIGNFARSMIAKRRGGTKQNNGPLRPPCGVPAITSVGEAAGRNLPGRAVVLAPAMATMGEELSEDHGT
jgi:hypothetical protein